jgi:hypothetical protein
LPCAITSAGKTKVMSLDQEEQWWNDLMAGCMPFALSWGYLAVGLLFLGLGMFAHKSGTLLLGVFWLALSGVNLAVAVVRRRRRRSRQGSDAR